MYFSIISQGEAPGNRLVPGGALAIRGSYSQWEYPRVVGLKTGSGNVAFSVLYGIGVLPLPEEKPRRVRPGSGIIGTAHGQVVLIRSDHRHTGISRNVRLLTNQKR
jgi:hypothetical protein